jgi:hypothetical protein
MSHSVRNFYGQYVLVIVHYSTVLKKDMSLWWFWVQRGAPHSSQVSNMYATVPLCISRNFLICWVLIHSLDIYLISYCKKWLLMLNNGCCANLHREQTLLLSASSIRCIDATPSGYSKRSETKWQLLMQKNQLKAMHACSTIVLAAWPTVGSYMHGFRKMIKLWTFTFITIERA